MRKILVLLLLTFLLTFWPGQNNTQAATGASLYLSPSVGVYSIGDYFSVVTKVDTNDVAINAAEAVIVFPSNKIDVISVSKTGSLFALWTEEPTFSSTAGTVQFGGGLPTPGFTGPDGTLITITFKAKAVGTALVSFSSGAVLANDGLGTNILTNMRDGNYTFQVAEIVPEPVLPTQVPLKPQVSSPTHPAPEKWYSNNNPKFTWQLPSDISGVSLILHEKPLANPGPISDGLMESKTFENVKDGVWYLHIKFRNQYGWGAITHRQVLIDTEPPQPFNIDVQKEGPTDPQPILIFKVNDETSGVEYYNIRIDELEIIEVLSENIKNDGWQMPPQPPGEHTVIVEAIDKAGNSTFATVNINIEALVAPEITEYPEKLQEGDILTLKGISFYPNSMVIVYLQKEDEEASESEVNTDEQGNWSYIYDKSVKKGIYIVWAKAKDSRGALSNPSEEITVKVTLPIILKYGKIAVDYLTMIITLIALLVFAFIAIFYAWYRISIWRKRLRKETREVVETIDKAFKALQEEVQEQVEQLDKKPGLSKQEKKVRDKLKEALDISEKFISKELEDVEKELE